MLRLDWNALRPGDHVFLHDDQTHDLRLMHGVVVAAEPRRGAANIVAIRCTRDGEPSTTLPRRQAVHSTSASGCWRCSLDDRAAPPTAALASARRGGVQETASS